MERLTTKIDSKYQLSDEFDYGGKYMKGYKISGECGNEEYDEYPDYSVAVDKLGQLEDIMEKYDIEDLELYIHNLWLSLQLASKEIKKFWDKDLNLLSNDIAEFYFSKAKKGE